MAIGVRGGRGSLRQNPISITTTFEEKKKSKAIIVESIILYIKLLEYYGN